jgi:hypothetical protein
MMNDLLFVFDYARQTIQFFKVICVIVGGHMHFSRWHAIVKSAFSAYELRSKIIQDAS